MSQEQKKKMIFLDVPDRTMKSHSIVFYQKYRQDGFCKDFYRHGLPVSYSVSPQDSLLQYL